MVWTTDAEGAFENMKHALCEAALLAHPSEQFPLVLTSDATDEAIGAALQQSRSGQLEPIAFFSRRLSDTERRYSTYNRELLGVFAAVKHFRNLLEGRNFEIFTDHRPLTYAFLQKPDKASPRQRRRLDFISQFTTSIQYVQGDDNVPADALSRIGEISSPTAIDYVEMAKAQLTDEDARKIVAGETAIQAKPVQLPDSPVLLWCDTAGGISRPIVPRSFRRAVFNSVHGLAHLGLRNTVNQVAKRFVW